MRRHDKVRLLFPAEEAAAEAVVKKCALCLVASLFCLRDLFLVSPRRSESVGGKAGAAGTGVGGGSVAAGTVGAVGAVSGESGGDEAALSLLVEATLLSPLFAARAVPDSLAALKAWQAETAPQFQPSEKFHKV